MEEQIQVLKEVAGRFEKLGIPYMVTGGMVTNLYAQPRLTRDIDIVLVLKPENVDPLAQTFQKDFYADKEMIQGAIRHRDSFNFIDQKFLVKIDCIIRSDEEYEIEKFDRRRKIKVRDFYCWIISAEDLILSKLKWALDSQSEMQLRDVKNLLDCVENLDFNYLEKWLSTLKLKALYQKAKQL